MSSSSLLKPLDKSLRRLLVSATYVEQQKNHLAGVIARTGIDSTDLAASLRELNEHAFQIVRDIAVLEAISVEVEEGPIIADDITGVIATVQLLDLVQEVDHFGLARFLENVKPDIIRLAIREVASFEGGEERLRVIRQALDEVEAEVDA